MSVTLGMLLPDQSLPAEFASRKVTGLALDSRCLQPGEAFIAVPGSSADGRNFIDAAIRAGASAVLAEAPHASAAELGGVPVIGVPRLHEHVGEVAARFHGQPAHGLRILGVTGTNGKTSTAWFLRDALSAAGMSCALVGTLGMRFAGQLVETGHTTPDAVTLHAGLAQFRDAGATAVSMEVSSHALAQSRLSGVPISVAVFTNLSRDHLDYHGDLENYFAAKAKLFARKELQLAVINRAGAHGRRLTDMLGGKLPVVGFGDDVSEIRCTEWVADEAGMRFTLELPGGTVQAQAPVYGRFNLENLMAVVGVLYGLEYRSEQIAAALEAITPVPGRMQPVAGSDIRVLVDYAHTPDGLEKALVAAREHFTGKIWCVIGCGGNRDAGKRPQMAAIAERLADRPVFTSDNPRFEEPQSILADMLSGVKDADRILVQADRPAAIARAIASADAGDVVLIAGKGHESWQEIRGEKIPMNDVALAQQALAARGGVQ